MKISILIDNYNYPQYVAQAVDSALAQTHEDVEVIVVDDGSTDSCPEILRQYAARVKLVLKDNGGQASAFNAGVRLATGEIVMFLDADDLLRPDAAAQVAAAWRPGMSKIHYPLALIDENADALGSMIPRVSLPAGDLSQHVLRRGFYVSPPTSGNAFSRELLEHIMPIADEQKWRQGTDGYLVFLAPFFGTIGTISSTIASYRIHGKSVTAMNGTGSMDSVRMSRLLDSDIRLRRTLEKFAADRGLSLSDHAVYSHWLHRKLRLACFKLSRDLHPFAGDTAMRLAWSLARAVWSAEELGMRSRLLFSGWGVLTALLPVQLAAPLIRMAFSPAARPAVLKGRTS